ncbi:UNVERIFIED_CONTAM: hypothetical protein FKN15_070059 [Acipenser sinensis]
MRTNRPLDAPIAPSHTFGPAVEEILQRFHREQEASRQVAVMLPSRAPVWDRFKYGYPDKSNPCCTACRPEASPIGFRGSQYPSHPQGQGRTGRGAPAHQHSGKQFLRKHPKQPPRQAPPQPQQPQYGP